MSNVNDVMNQTMAKMKELVDVNSVVGNPINTPDGTTLIPVSKVTFGFASGGSDGTQKAEKAAFGAGSGAGVSITPIAFIVITNGNVRMIYIDPPTNSSIDKVIDMVPDLINKFAGKKKGVKKEEAEEAEEEAAE